MPWSVTDEPSIIAWYKADSMIGTYSNGANVVTWNDSSGSGNHLTGGAGTLTFVHNAVGSMPGMRTGGTAWRAPGTRITTCRSVYVAVKHATGTNESAYEFLFGDSSTGGTYDWHGGAGTALFDPTYSNGNINSCFVDGVSIIRTLMVKPKTPKVLSFITSTNVTIGNVSQDRDIFGRIWNGDYYEIIVSSDAHTTAQRKRIEQYLIAKWTGINGGFFIG